MSPSSVFRSDGEITVLRPRSPATDHMDSPCSDGDVSSATSSTTPFTFILENPGKATDRSKATKIRQAVMRNYLMKSDSSRRKRRRTSPGGSVADHGDFVAIAAETGSNVQTDLILKQRQSIRSSLPDSEAASDIHSGAPFLDKRSQDYPLIAVPKQEEQESTAFTSEVVEDEAAQPTESDSVMPRGSWSQPQITVQGDVQAPLDGQTALDRDVKYRYEVNPSALGKSPIRPSLKREWPSLIIPDNSSLQSPLPDTRAEYSFPAILPAWDTFVSVSSSLDFGHDTSVVDAERIAALPLSTYTCEIQGCKKSFTSKTEYAHHQRNHAPRTHACPTCNKAFVFRKDLTRHMDNIHSPYHANYFCSYPGCRWAERGFKRKDHLDRHMKTHQGPAPQPVPSSDVLKPLSNRLMVKGRDSVQSAALGRHDSDAQLDIQVDAVNNAAHVRKLGLDDPGLVHAGEYSSREGLGSEFTNDSIALHSGQFSGDINSTASAHMTAERTKFVEQMNGLDEQLLHAADMMKSMARHQEKSMIADGDTSTLDQDIGPIPGSFPSDVDVKPVDLESNHKSSEGIAASAERPAVDDKSMELNDEALLSDTQSKSRTDIEQASQSNAAYDTLMRLQARPMQFSNEQLEMYTRKGYNDAKNSFGKACADALVLDNGMNAKEYAAFQQRRAADRQSLLDNAHAKVSGGGDESLTFEQALREDPFGTGKVSHSTGSKSLDNSVPSTHLDDRLDSTNFIHTELVQRMQETGARGVKLQDRRWHIDLYRKTFRGDEMTTWLLGAFKDLNSREDAVNLGNTLMTRGVFTHVRDKHRFMDGHYFYQIAAPYQNERAPPDHASSVALDDAGADRTTTYTSTVSRKAASESTAPLTLSTDPTNPTTVESRAEQCIPPEVEEDRMTIRSGSDIGTIFLSDDRKQVLADTVAATLTSQLGQAVLDEQLMDTMKEMLRTFAVMQAQVAITAADRVAARTFRQQRGLIASRYFSVQENFTFQSDQSSIIDEDEDEPRKHYLESAFDRSTRIRGWMASFEAHNVELLAIHPEWDPTPGPGSFPEAQEAMEMEIDQPTELPDPHHRELHNLMHGTSWSWLIARMQTMATTSIWQSKISQRLLQCLTSSDSLQHTTRVINERCLNVAYYIDWAPAAFLATNVDQDARLADIVTVTSDGKDVQAATAGAYITQTWPQWGEIILATVQDLLDSKKVVFACPITSDIKLHFICDERRVTVRSCAPVSFQVDLGDILAWLASTLRDPAMASSAAAKEQIPKIVYCRPVIEPAKADPRLPTSSLIVDISFQYASRQASDEGSCWQALFGQCTIADGFPVQARSGSQKGMEVTLGSLATLAEANYATIFNNKFMLKGLTSLLYPSSVDTQSINWHFEQTGDQYISHDAAMLSCLGKQSLTEIVESFQSVRHFVGWTPQVLSTLGTTAASKQLGEPSAVDATDGTVLGEASITTGQQLPVDDAMLCAKYMRAAWTTSTSAYEDVLQFASDITVLLFDCKARRGFLVDGCSALLHLAWLRLQSPRARRFWDHDVAERIDGFTPAGTRAGVDHAIEVLRMPTNRALVLRTIRDERTKLVKNQDGMYEEQTEVHLKYWTFEDLILDLWQYLSKIWDYQQKSLNDIQASDRDRLEGWSFKSIVERRPVIKAKVAKLQASGRGWNDFIRSIGACTLMANGFGEVLYSSLSACSSWKQIPADKDYLAVSIATLREISEQSGSCDGFPAALSHTTLWHKPSTLFESCPPGCESRCDRTQVMLPTKWPGQRSPPCEDELPEDGAVCFGTSSRYKIYWPSRGPPQLVAQRDRTVSPEGQAKDVAMGIADLQMHDPDASSERGRPTLSSESSTNFEGSDIDTWSNNNASSESNLTMWSSREMAPKVLKRKRTSFTEDWEENQAGPGALKHCTGKGVRRDGDEPHVL